MQFLAVNVGGDDSIVAMAAQAVEHEIEFPFVKDFDGSWAAPLGVKRTPEVVVLDAERTAALPRPHRRPVPPRRQRARSRRDTI